MKMSTQVLKQKSLFLVLFLAFFVNMSVKAQMSCCMLETFSDYQLLGAAEDFRRAHAEPLPFTFVSQQGGTMIQFATKDSLKGNGFLIRAKKKSKRWLFVYQEWWGLNDYIKRQSEVFYEALGGEVNVLAIDCYDGKIATKREEAGELMKNASEPRIENIIRGAMSFAGKKAQIASVGWCFGGGWSLRSALIEGKQAVGCVMYYGMPVKEAEKLKSLNCSVLGMFAGKEKWINKDVVLAFDANMKSVGKQLTYKIFDNEHAFANPSNPNFDEAASKEAFEMAINYLKTCFKF